jgi:hypothetical protein
VQDDDADYFSNRAFEERRAAKIAHTLCASRAHSELANRYALSARTSRLAVPAGSLHNDPALRDAYAPGIDGPQSSVRFEMRSNVAHG